MEEPQVPVEVSVIIVTYNSAATIRRCLAALETSADREKLEIIVVDNGSWDRTTELVAEFPKTALLKLPRNFGFTKALNIGMRTAKAEFYFFLSPHIEVQPDTVSRLAAKLSEENSAVAVCPLLTTPDGEPSPGAFELPTAETVAALAGAGAFDPTTVSIDRESVPVPLASLSACMIRSYFLKGLRYIDERYAQFWADAEIGMQIRRAAKKILLFPATRVIQHPDETPEPPAGIRALLAADWASGASVYAGKHFGFAAGLKVRLSAVFGALLRFQLPLMSKIISAQKVDGTQSNM